MLLELSKSQTPEGTAIDVCNITAIHNFPVIHMQLYSRGITLNSELHFPFLKIRF